MPVQEEVRALFVQALELPASERPRFLAGATTSDSVRDAVAELLRLEDGADTMLTRTITAEYPAALGRRFGAYVLKSLLGRGGMGSVYLAERVDGELNQTVALKIVDRALFDPKALERFRYERQILARLSHPNIAHLLDGGTSEDGVPYLVLEFVDGVPLHQYCQDRHLSTEERIRLFLPLCEALEYAHAHLVVHRDLKPSNVLVSADGMPKLLDFGIAKALDQVDASLTATLMMTPQFASPEQVRGEKITTATDVYGLGGLLYHLLTGQPPHPLEHVTPYEMQKAICNGAITRPSLLAPALRGDLENILLRALHPDASRRYSSVRDFTEDLRAYVEARPVSATPDTVWYRSRKFVQRHALAVAAGVLAIAAVLGGLGLALYEARVAERRFADVQQLASRFVFDFERSIRDVKGTLPTRRMVASTARDYLEKLAAESHKDKSLTRDLAEAYYRLGGIESSLGDSKAALQHMARSAAMLESVADDCCGADAQRLLYVKDLAGWARGRAQSQDVDGGLALSTKAVANARQWSSKAPANESAKLALAAALSQHGETLELAGKTTAARQALTEGVILNESLLAANYADPDFELQYASTLYELADLCVAVEDGQAARHYATRTQEAVDRFLALNPEALRLRRLRILSASASAGALSILAKEDHSLQGEQIRLARLAYDEAQAQAANDSNDKAAADLAIVMTSRLAWNLRQVKRYPETIHYLEQAQAEIAKLIDLDPANRRAFYLREDVEGELAIALAAAGRWREADAAFAQEQRYFDQSLAGAPNDAVVLENEVSSYGNWADVAMHLGDAPRAHDLCQRGLELAARMMKKDASVASYLNALPDLRAMAKKWNIPDPTAGLK